MNGSSLNEGRVEACMNGGWRPVCANDQNSSALTESICLALGLSEQGKNFRRKHKTRILHSLILLQIQCLKSMNLETEKLYVAPLTNPKRFYVSSVAVTTLFKWSVKPANKVFSKWHPACTLNQSGYHQVSQQNIRKMTLHLHHQSL